MLVTNSQENITHAIIGGNETMDFGVSNNAEFFQILSSSLYTNQILAVVREVLCNAWDAHIEAGLQDTPILVSLQNNEFVVRDYGSGIPKQDIQTVYGVYGQSTKRQNGTVTGGFGLGCKAPFAYQDHFEVTSWNQKEKTIYAMCRSAADTQGKPGITPIVSMPSEETGLQVKMTMKPQDIHSFVKYIKDVVSFGEMKVLFDRALTNDPPILLPVIPFSESKTGFTITEATLDVDTICIRYGNVVYPLTKEKAYDGLYEVVKHTLKRLSSYRIKNTLILHAPPNSVCVAPSREALSMQAKTIDTVKALLTNFNEQTTNVHFLQTLSAIENRHINLIDKNKTDLYTLFNSGLYCGLVKKPIIQTIEDFAEGVLITHRSCLDYKNTHRCALKLVDTKHKGTLYSLLKHKENNVPIREWFHKQFCVKMDLFIRRVAPTVQEDLLFYQKGRYNLIQSSLDEIPFHSVSVPVLIKKVVILSCAKATIKNRLDNWGTDLKDYIALIQLVKRTDPNLDKLREALAKRSDITFIDLTVKHSWEIVDKVVTETKTYSKGVVKVSEILKGYAPKNGRELLEEGSHIVNPTFVVHMSRGDTFPNTPFNTYSAKALFKRYGELGGICTTDTSVRAYLGKGAILFEEFVIKEIHKHLIKNRRVKRLYSIKMFAESENNRLGLAILASNELSKYFGIFTKVTDDDLFFYNLFLELKNKKANPLISDIHRFFNTTKKHNFFVKLEELIENDILIKYLDLWKFTDLISSANTSKQEDRRKAVEILKLKLEG